MIWILFFWSIYGVKNLIIDEFNKQQMVMAEQAAAGIRGCFEYMSGELEYISKVDDVYRFNERGRRLIEDYFKRKGGIVKSVTRVDNKGKIVWLIPYDRRLIGADISSQPHVSYAIREHKISVSDIFKSVQGYSAVALHIPVIRNGEFEGTLAMLIDFEYISKKFLEKIVIGEDGYAWMVNSQGIVLYSPVPGFLGRSMYEVSSGFPDLVRIIDRMTRGEKGTGVYRYNLVREEYVDTVIKQVSFAPVEIMNKRWSIAVATPEKQILSIINNLRKEMLIIALLLIMVNGALFYFAVTGKNLKDVILKKKRYEDFLAENEAVLEVTLASAGKVAGGIAHDLNNVLAGILNAIEVLEMKHAEDEKTAKYAGFVRDAALRGAGLVKKLANLSLVGGNVNTSIDVHQVIKEALLILEDKLEEDRIKIQLDATDYIVKASPLNLRKIIIRLAGEIIDVISENGNLQIATENPERIDVESEDRKVKPERGGALRILFRIFREQGETGDIERLFLFLKEGEEPDENTEPGISDSFRRVRELGGDMGFETADDYETVSIILPVQNEDRGLKLYPEAAAGGGILIVEDEEAIRTALHRILTDLGYTVYTAEDGLSGVELFRKEHGNIDLVILDIVMPVKGGLETLQEIMEIDTETIVYMTSGYVTGVNIDDWISKGASGFISKPVTVSDLNSIVSRAITGKKSETGDRKQ